MKHLMICLAILPLLNACDGQKNETVTKPAPQQVIQQTTVISETVTREDPARPARFEHGHNEMIQETIVVVREGNYSHQHKEVTIHRHQAPQSIAASTHRHPKPARHSNNVKNRDVTEAHVHSHPDRQANIHRHIPVEANVHVHPQIPRHRPAPVVEVTRPSPSNVHGHGNSAVTIHGHPGAVVEVAPRPANVHGHPQQTAPVRRPIVDTNVHVHPTAPTRSANVHVHPAAKIPPVTSTSVVHGHADSDAQRPVKSQRKTAPAAASQHGHDNDSTS